MPRIFISYRRADTEAITGRIHEHLSRAFGPHNVFMDVENIRPGEDFRERLRRAVRACDVVLVIIGPNWVNALDRNGYRRLDDPNDFVRIEVEAALRKKGTKIIPILVNGASMPTIVELPPSLQPLAYYNAAQIHNNPYFRPDMDWLIRHLKPRSWKWLWVSAALFLLLIGGIALTYVMRDTFRDLLDTGGNGGKASTGTPQSNAPTPNPTIFVQQGLIYFNQGDYAQAIVNFNMALSMQVNDPAIFYQRGLAYEALNDCAAAVADYSAVIERAPDHQDALIRRGVLYLICINDLNLAMTDFNQLVELNPNNVWGYFYRGQIYTRQSAWDQAITEYTAALNLDSALIEAYLGRGDAYLAKETYDLAQVDYTSAVELNDLRPEAHLGLARVYDVTNQPDLALEQYRRYVELTAGAADPAIITRLAELESQLAPQAEPTPTATP